MTRSTSETPKNLLEDCSCGTANPDTAQTAANQRRVERLQKQAEDLGYRLEQRECDECCDRMALFIENEHGFCTTEAERFLRQAYDYLNARAEPMSSRPATVLISVVLSGAADEPERVHGQAKATNGQSLRGAGGLDREPPVRSVTSGDESGGTNVGDWLPNGRRTQPRPASANPMCWTLPIGDQPPVDRTGDSEMYVLQMIENGRTVVALWHALARMYAPRKVEQFQLPDWAEPETYYDAITDVLQAAVYAGFDAEELCRQAIDSQQGMWDEGQAMANELRGPKR